MTGKFAFEKALRGRTDLTHTQFRVLILLVGYADGELSGAHPGTERLAEDACISVMTARRQLQALEKAGWISVVGNHHSGHGRGGVAKVYAVHLPADGSDSLFIQMNTGSAGPSDHPDEQLVGDNPVFKSDDSLFISDDPLFTQMNTHHVNTPGQFTRSSTPAESSSTDDLDDGQVHDGQDGSSNGKPDKPSESSRAAKSLLPIKGDESPAELRMIQLRNKGHPPADAIRILLAEQRKAQP